MRWSRTIPGVLSILVGTLSARAQRLEQRFPVQRLVPIAVRPDSNAPAPGGLRLGGIRLPRRDSSWWVPLTSLIVPGAGQALLGQGRFVGYAAVEGYVIFDYLQVSAHQRSERNRSRVLAHDVARSLFGGTRPVGPWAYYERMEEFVESGVFNRLPGAELTPEIDVATFNGFLWLDIRQRYWDNPNIEPAHSSAQYRNSLNEYIARAVRDDFRWSWRNAQLEQDIYRGAIRRENQDAHTAAALVNALIVNRLLSTVDAFITLRLRYGAGVGGAPKSLEASLPWPSLRILGGR